MKSIIMEALLGANERKGAMLPVPSKYILKGLTGAVSDEKSRKKVKSYNPRSDNPGWLSGLRPSGQW